MSTTFAGIRRAHRRPLRKKTALVLEPLRVTLSAIPDTLPGHRDRALILVGFAAALRPSELARLDIAALTRHEDGIALFLPWRKNDQEAHGTTVWLPAGQTDLCPVTALEAWLAAAEIVDGPLFRRLWHLPPPRVRKGTRKKPIADRCRIGTRPIDTDSIALIVKKWTGEAGLDAATFAGHSLRRGAISSGVAQGVHIARLKQFSGHASLKSLEEYVELDELRHNPSAQGRALTKLRDPVAVAELTGARMLSGPGDEPLRDRQSRRCPQRLVDDAEPLAGFHEPLHRRRIGVGIQLECQRDVGETDRGLPVDAERAAGVPMTLSRSPDRRAA